MKRVFNNKMINKVVLGLLGLVLSVMIASSLSADGSKVLAASGDQVLDSSTDFLTVEYTADDAKTKIGTSAPAQPTMEGYEDWLFAGWYKNIECTSPIRTADEATDSCYAKFVPTNVLSVKCQVLEDTTSESEKTNMRFTTSIDTNQYWNVGFVISRDGKSYNYTTRFAYERIEASETSGVTVQYSPKVIDTKSEAFVTYTIKNIPNTDGNRYFDTVFMARPFWTTWDGVRVYGVTRYASVSDSYNDVVNIPVKVEQSATAYTVENFGITETTYNSTSGAATDTLIDGANVSVRYNLNQNYAALVMTGKTGLSSATKYTITNNEEESTYIHRNLETKYAGTADTTWYYADSAEDEFIIVTSADLYGLSKIAGGTDNFLENTVYVVSDIEANVGRAASDGWKTVEEDGTTPITNATEYPWQKIGTYGNPFEGTFDGQGHTISGINYSAAEGYVGFFGKTTANSTIKNFKLANSYIGNTLTTGDAYLGAVAGYGGGNFETIKSEAYINSGAGKNGGIVGYMEGESITDCWYSGTMTLGTNGKNSGGIVGMIGDSIVTMEHCLYSGAITGSGSGTGSAYGGLCGHLYGNASLTIEDSLTVGTVTAGGGNYHGTIIGYMYGGSASANANLYVSNTYTQEDGCEYAIRLRGYGTIYYEGADVTVTNGIKNAVYGKMKTETELAGCDGYYNDTIALDFVNYWGPVVGGTPELLTFSDNALDVWDGEGTESLPWMIYTEEELKTLATLTTLSENPYNFTEKYVQLGADIMVVNADTLADVQKKATTEDNWTPIGSSTNPFEGTFDGDMKTISGLYYQGSDEYIGLFGCIGNNSTVQKLKLSEACYFENQNSGAVARIGSVVGCLRGKLDTIKSEATVVSIGQANGGIAGEIYYSGAYDANVNEVKITNTWFGGALNIPEGAGRISGGIVGRIYGPNRYIAIEHCLVTSTIEAIRPDSDAYLGGLIGYAWGYKKLSVNDSLVTSVIQNENLDTGAIIGRLNDVDFTLQDVYAVKDTTYVHDITGSNTSGNLASNSESSNYGVLDVALDGYDGWYNTTLDFETSWSAISEDTPQLTCFKEGTALDTLTGKGQESSPWMINNAEDLKLLASLAESTYNFSEKYLELGATITVNDGTTNWTPIGSATNAFAGNFNGANETISGLYYKGNGTNIGLFGRVGATGNISNFTLADSTFESTATGNAWIGGIVGYANGGNYTNIKVADNVTVTTTGACAGGVAGTAWGGNATFDTCWSAATINMDGEVARQAGGIVGRVYGGGRTITIRHCLNTGNVISTTTTKTPHAGGFCGLLNGATLNIVDSLNTKNVQSQYNEAGYVGSVIGTIESGTFTLNQVYGINGYELFGTNEEDGTFDEANSADYAALVADAMTSDASWLNLNLDFENSWYPVSDSTPELRAFPTSDELVTWEGEGTEELPWIFDTAEELKRFTQAAKTHAFEGEYVQLGTDAQAGTLDIAMNDCESVEDLKTSDPDNWTPIGNATTPFAGNFNGNGNTISGIYCTGSTSKAGLGLFGYTAEGSMVQNLSLTKSYFEYTGTGATVNTNMAYMGSIAGLGNGDFSTIKSDAVIVSNGAYNGGLVGAANAENSITNCWFAGSIDLGTDAGSFAGGILGFTQDAANVTVDNCLNTGAISGTNSSGGTIHIGGLCGYIYQGELTMKNSLNVGEISAKGTQQGSILGRNNGGTINIYNLYYSNDNRTCTYAIPGTYYGVAGDSDTTDDLLGYELAALKGDGGWLNTDLDFDTYWNPIVDSTPELQAFPSGTVVTMWEGEGTEDSPWILSSADELWRLTNASPYHNYENEFIKLGADIAINEGTLDEIKEASPKNWRPIGVSNKPFEGNFDGDGHTISGLYYKGEGNHIGLFAVTGNTSVIHNLKVKNSYFESTLDADATTVEETENVRIGSIAGVAYGTYENIKSDAEVVCYGMAGGGLVGMVHHYGTATFDDCWFSGTLYVQGAASHCGGLIGKINARNEEGDTPVKITNCLNSGTIVIDARNTNVARVGGICGSITSAQEVIITNCLNAKSFVTMRERCSSIIGAIEYTVEEGETATTTVTLTNVYAIKGLGSDGTYNTDTVTFTEEQDGVEVENTVTYSMFHGYHVDENMISITDCAILTEEQLAGENAVTAAPSLFVADTNGVVHWAQGVLYPTLNMEGEVLTALPEMVASDGESTTTTLSTGDRNMVTTVTKTTSADYTTYLTALETAGFESYATNEIGTVENEKVISNTYTRENLVLCANYFEKTGETTLSYYEGPVSENLVYKESYVADNEENANTTLHMLELFHYGNSFVIQLKNGHFIISDGGFEEDLPYLFDYLEELAGDEKPVIEAWFITHAHGDHTGAFNALWGDREDHELIGRVYVNGVYYSSPSDVILEDPDCGAETLDYTLKRTVNMLRTESGEQTRLYRPQTGQRYYFNDTTIDILLAQEHLALDGTDGARANLNSSSTVCLFTSDEGTSNAQTCLLSGDIEEAGYDVIFNNYEDSLFNVNFFTLNHHGFNTGVNIANKITADTVLLTVRDETPVRRATAIAHLISKAKESMAWGNGTVVFTLPHTASEETQNYVVLPSKEEVDESTGKNGWIYHEDVERTIQPHLTDGTDTTVDGTYY